MRYRLGTRFNIFIPNTDAGALMEIFMVSAISSLLILRAYLSLTGYPKIGSGDFHIAHMLWGGFLMVVAIFILLMTLDNQAKKAAALVGGIGFGAFIDELGKFITSDNDYFFQPTIVLIYVIFVMLFMFIRAAERYIQLSNRDYAINALEVIKEVVLYDLDEQEQKKALHFLELSDHDNPVIAPLKNIITALQAKEKKGRHPLVRIKKWFRDIYISAIHKKWFVNILNIYFIAFAVFNLGIGYFAVLEKESFNSMGQFFSSIAALAFAILGGYFLLRRKRLAAYEMFKRSVLISILITQFFLFYREELAALTILLLSLPILVISQYLIDQEQILSGHKHSIL